MTQRPEWHTILFLPAMLLVLGFALVQAQEQIGHPVPPNAGPHGTDGTQQSLLQQTAERALAQSAGCVQCHQNEGDPHGKETLHLGCVDCHGGDSTSHVKEQAHVAPGYPEAWPTSANPVRSYTLLNHESPEFIRFVNPGDLRVAHLSCGMAGCHAAEVLENRKSMMTHGCMLWGSALYNNGSFPLKQARFGESYSTDGVPQRLQTVPPPTEEEIRCKGVVPYLDALPRYEISQPGNILRIFERGGRFRPEVGIPETEEVPGRPRTRLSDRGLGTQNRTDPVFIGLQKTRLLDPTLNFLGTNDHPGDYRSSGCTACHVIYANDRWPVTSGPYASAGNQGRTQNPDPTIPKDESGHPIQHRFTNAIPTSQCNVCHVHPGTSVMNSYSGFTWWDEETDGNLMYPVTEKHPTAEQYVQGLMNNPDEASIRGLWSDPQFLQRVWELNGQTRHTQFADFHGHGWVFRAVFRKDRHGTLLDHRGVPIPDVTTANLNAAMLPPTPQERCTGKARDGVPVQQLDIHLEKGMHCVDCHFTQDVHGNTKLYQEVRAAIEIQCIDCHGSATDRPNLRTTGPAAPPSGRTLEALRTPFGARRFEWRGNKLFQHSMVEPDLTWEITQVVDTLDPQSEHYNAKSRLAKTVRFGDDNRLTWGDIPKDQDRPCAHTNKNMSCIACHSSWNPSCFGCHLPQKANLKLPQLHNDGDVTRNYVAYNFQTLRDDVFMLARDGIVTGNRIGPARSSCAIHVGSYNQNRESIYVQQQTISAEGMSGVAFSSNVPHTVRGRGETKNCTDCHISLNNDNNAILAQLMMQGTGYVNFVGRYCWVAEGEYGLEAVEVTERDEPQAVIGSYLHQLAFPDSYGRHLHRGESLEHAYPHPGKDISDNVLHPLRKNEVLAVQNRGEYLYAACGEGGVRVFDIAFIDDKAFSQRITTAPVSPCGQKFYVPTAYAAAIAAPTTIAPDPTRTHRSENMEPDVHPLYGYIYVADKCEGLILIGAATTINGNPLDNFLKRALTYNPDGLLRGGRAISIIGCYAYLLCDAGLVVICIDDPLHPKVTAVLGREWLTHPTSLATQFRYAYVCDEDCVKVLDITDLSKPRPVCKLAVPGAVSIYLARTYAYVAAGANGLVILDIERPDQPRVDQMFTADGCINDLHDVKLGITYTSEFAYLADGRNGLRIVQLTSPETPGNDGFSPRPTPRLIATYKSHEGGPALAVARGVDRDRAVDECGNQIAVFGRIGARPLNQTEQQRLYLRNNRPWQASDDPTHLMYGTPREYVVPGR